MRKITYSAPVIEITKWEKQDIITASGLSTSSTALDRSTIGTEKSVKTISYNDIIS
jgi:hypothetical protein